MTVSELDTQVTRLDIAELRAAFPSLARGEAGRPFAYFDGPGGTQVPQRVIDVMVRYLKHHNANTHWNYQTSRETDELISQARSRFGDFLGCDAAEVIFGANMTSLTFHLSRALGRRMGPGDEIVVTELDHHANVAPWTALAVERGVTIRVAPMRTDDGTLDLEALGALIGPRTRLVAIGRASNALGTITEISSVVDEAHSRDALVFVDAVHSAAHERTDVREIGCDFLTCSPYKFYGPHLGVMYARGDVLADLDVARLEPAADTGPERMETGTLPHEAVVGAGEAVQFLADLGDSGVLGDSADLAGGGSQDGAISESAESERSADGERRAALDRSFIALHQHGSELVTRMWEGLASVPGVRLFGPGPSEPRTPTVGFVVEAVASSVVSSRLSDEAGVFVSHGDFYATTVVRRLGLGEEGLVRAGAACYTTEDEVDRLVAGVRRISG